MSDTELNTEHGSEDESDASTLHSKDALSIHDEVFDEKHNIFDIAPPLREPLSARYKHSFAYKTFRKRVPQMLNELISCMRENETRIMEQCGNYARYDLRRVIWSLEILRTEVQKNSEFKHFIDKDPGASEWNIFIKKLENREKNQWFTSTWMDAECYLYRRIWAAFRRADTLSSYDYFSPKKICSTRNNVFLLLNVLKGTRDLPRCRLHFLLMLKLSLWANRCDLSIRTDAPNERFLEQMADFDEQLIADQSEDVWRLLTEGIHTSVCPVTVDIVLDNAGFELFADLLLGEYLIQAGLAVKVRYHVKAIPWFVSDVTANDFNWMLQFLLRHEISELSAFGRKLRRFMRNKSMELCNTCSFWTKPQCFKFMREMAPCLYVQLSLGALTIFKGDLNYRKLLDDVNWSSTTPFGECLSGFLPTSICALRSIKSDIYCGLPICVVEWLTEEDPNWMCTGEKAVIQLAVKARP
ncbi:damage-control phosphatase ARMT1 [Drosophila novamexicana]|uniref:damage-control phosphatase ARMT1 n=1 Tax=Drosophila novamexicana TaxID=47314 RepID=UPI0011E58FF4|nr:damage-control phosphatase ARMT1 [Drosophila novamexicana]